MCDEEDDYNVCGYFMQYALFEQFIKLLQDDTMSVRCTACSMTNRIYSTAYDLGVVLESDPPMPVNFRDDGRRGLKFDFPEKVDIGEDYSIRFDYLMVDSPFVRAADYNSSLRKDNLRCLRPYNLVQVDMVGDTVTMEFELVGGHREWFEFAIETTTEK